MYSNDPISKWQDYALNSDIQPEVLIEFALNYWLTKNIGTSLEIELINFTKLLNAICSLNGKFIALSNQLSKYDNCIICNYINIINQY
jgi:hypothetical protein